MLGERVSLSPATSNVQLTITSLCLKLSDLDTGRVLHQHEMPNISFASGGDSDTLDYIAYVAKDSSGGRGCYVLECSGGLAQGDIARLCSHWSSSCVTALSLVQSFIVTKYFHCDPQANENATILFQCLIR